MTFYRARRYAVVGPSRKRLCEFFHVFERVNDADKPTVRKSAARSANDAGDEQGERSPESFRGSARL
jgi:hypothetical protein